MAMWVVQAHREGRWAAWGPQGLDLVIQRSGMGTVPGCTRAGLPMVAGRGSEVRGKSDPCHGMTSPPSFSISNSTQPHPLTLQLLHANSEAHLHNYAIPTVGLAPD